MCCDIYYTYYGVAITVSIISLQKSSTGKAPPRPEYGVVYVALEYPPWQKLALMKLRELWQKLLYLRRFKQNIVFVCCSAKDVYTLSYCTVC